MTRYDIARMSGYNSVEEYDEAEKRKHEIFTESLKRQKPDVEKEPVKIQPVNRGRWIYKGTVNSWDEMACSCCDWAFSTQDREQILDWEFCPHCGAKMRNE